MNLTWVVFLRYPAHRASPSFPRRSEERQCAGRRRIINSWYSLPSVQLLEYLQTHTLSRHTYFSVRRQYCVEEEAGVITRLAKFVLLCIWAQNEVKVYSGSSWVFWEDFLKNAFLSELSHSSHTLHGLKRFSHLVRHQSTPGVHGDG